MRLHLVDSDAAVVSALRDAFSSFPEVVVSQGDLLALAHQTVVSPVNSYGFMDGGIDRAYLAFFGTTIQARIQEAIARRPEGYLPVGASLVVRTGHDRVPYLIAAPTMLTPESVDSENCYRAMRAVLRVAGSDAEVGRVVFCPGLGTGVGIVAPDAAARQMALAYSDWKGSPDNPLQQDRPRFPGS